MVSVLKDCTSVVKSANWPEGGIGTQNVARSVQITPNFVENFALMMTLVNIVLTELLR